MMMSRVSLDSLTELMRAQALDLPVLPPALVEGRVLELEQMGLFDIEEYPGIPSMVRQYAIASFHVQRPDYFVTLDEDMLSIREMLEARYGVCILSVPEAVLLLRETDGPPN